MKKKVVFFLATGWLLTLHFLCGAQYSVLLNFNGKNGHNPQGSLMLSGYVLYGMTTGGGANGVGNIFSIHTDGSGYKDLLDFNVTNGSYPAFTTLCLSGNVLYGMTSGGNYPGIFGNVFSIDTDGNNFKDLLDFNGKNGYGPLGSLTCDSGVLYGMTGNGGATYKSFTQKGYGCIFSINTDGTGYKDLLDFNGTNGLIPENSLTLSGGKLYGTTTGGGLYSNGIIFSINTNGSGFTDLFDFNGTNGASPTCNLTLSGSLMYGMTFLGGANNYGTIFSINTNGTGFTLLFECDSIHGGISLGDFTLFGNVLYSVNDLNSGANRDGSIFSINTNGTGYSDLFDFNGTDGINPVDITISGNTMYGMTNTGGSHDYGVIFSYKVPGLGVEEQSETAKSINLYPNPNNGTFTISLSNITEKCNVEVYNVLGERVYFAALPQTPKGAFPKGMPSQSMVDLIGQANGVYFYRVISESGELVGDGKIVIQK